jgi:hypothetical protein
LVTAVTVAATAAPSYAATSLTLGATAGPSGGGNTVTMTAPSATFASGQAVEFQYVGSTTCATTYQTPVAVAATGTTTVTQTAGIIAVTSFTINSGTSALLTVPSGVALYNSGGTVQTYAKYNICVYAGTTVGSSALVANGSAIYTIGIKAVIAGISPSSGSIAGGTVVTIRGANFPALVSTGTQLLTASVGGTALTITSVAADGTSFTATAPPHAEGGPFLLSVSTPGGATTTIGSTTTKANLFRYTNGIVITPNTVPNNRYAPTPVDVRGVNFASLTFTTTGTIDDVNAHVYLVPGTYDPAGSTKANGEVAECVNVIVISDQELVCSMLAGLKVVNGASVSTARSYTDTTWNGSGVVTTGGVTSGGSGVMFSKADLGSGVTAASGSSVPPGSVITVFTSPTTVTFAPSTGTISGSGGTLGLTVGSRVSAADGTLVTGGGTTLSSATANFSLNDLGKLITGADIPANTTIIGYTAGSTPTVTLSNATTNSGAVTNEVLTITNVAPVPVGTYTLTVVSNGLNDVQANGNNEDLNYTASVISNGSTFTVSDY